MTGRPPDGRADSEWSVVAPGDPGVQEFGEC
jgi:hypothetical protein